MSNQEIAAELLHQAREWSKRKTNLFRVRAYRQAAISVMGLGREVREILRTEGKHGLIDVPGIGTSLAEDIATFVRLGVWIADEHRGPRRQAG